MKWRKLPSSIRPFKAHRSPMIGPPPPTKVGKITDTQKEGRGKTNKAIYEH